MNPPWNQNSSDQDFNQGFEKAVEITGQELKSAVENVALSWLPARSIVEAAFKSRFEIHESGKILVLSQFCPWGSHLEDLEQEAQLNSDQLIFYVVFCDSGGSWRVRAVSVNSGSFESRKSLPEPWRGVRDEELSKLTGVEGCVFAHASGFIGGAKTREGALQMAKLALEH